MSLLVNQLIGFGVVSASAATSTWLASTFSMSGLTTYTFAAMSFGTASADRYLIAGFIGGVTTVRTVSSVTIGGVTATELYYVANGATAAAFYIAAVPTGTSGDVVITWSAGYDRCGVSLWSATGLGSTTVVDTGTSTADPYNDTMNCNAGGFILGVGFDNGGPSTWTWTNLTERADTDWGGPSHGTASDNFASAQSALSITADGSTAITNGVFAMVALGP